MRVSFLTVLLGLAGCVVEDTATQSPLGPIGPSTVLYEEAAVDIGLGSFSSPPPDAVSNFMYTEDRANGGGGALVDLDGDGDLDLVVTAPYGPNAMFLWDGDSFDRVPTPTFEDLPLTTSVSAADLDGDGLRDLLIGADSQLIAYRNLGDGVFERESILVNDDPMMRVEGAALADVDGDGFVDMYVSIQSRHLIENRPTMGRDRVFLGRGGFEFEEISSRFGSNEDRSGLTFAATWFDADRDGYLDAFVVKDRGSEFVPATLLVNPGGDGPWTSEAAERYLDVQADGMGVAVGDVQGDGDVEVVISDNYGLIHVRSIHDGIARDVGPAWGVINQDVELHETSWGVALADIDNDADLDLIAAFGRREVAHHLAPMQNNLWEWIDPAGRFRERTELLAMDVTSELEAWRGVLPGDIDGDGTLELVFTSHVGPISVQRTAATRNHWVAIELVGPSTNPDALGAEVLVRTGDKEFVQWMGSGVQGVHSATQPRMHVGLGSGETDVTVEVRWPNGETSTYADLAFDTIHRLSP